MSPTYFWVRVLDEWGGDLHIWLKPHDDFERLKRLWEHKKYEAWERQGGWERPRHSSEAWGPGPRRQGLRAPLRLLTCIVKAKARAQ